MAITSNMTVPELEPPLYTKFDTSGLEGTWLRTDTPIRGIVRVIVDAARPGLQVSVASVIGSEATDWGTIRVDAIYAASPESKTAVAFTTRYELPSINVELHANLSKGLLVLASMTRFPDGRRGQFARDFFRKVEGRLHPGGIENERNP